MFLYPQQCIFLASAVLLFLIFVIIKTLVQYIINSKHRQEVLDNQEQILKTLKLINKRLGKLDINLKLLDNKLTKDRRR